jgi:hypothetical protein
MRVLQPLIAESAGFLVGKNYTAKAQRDAKGRKAGTMNLLGVWKTPQPKLCDPLRPLRLCGKSSWMGAFGVEGAGLAAIVSA